MNERDNILGNEDTQNTQLELDLTSSTAQPAEEVAPVEACCPEEAVVAETVNEEVVDKKAAKKAEKAAKKAEKQAKKDAKKAEKLAKKAAEKAEEEEDDDFSDEDEEVVTAEAEVEETEVETVEEAPAKPKFIGRKIFAWLATVVAIVCAVLPLSTLLGPDGQQIASTSLLTGFFSAFAPTAAKLNLELEAITSAPAILSGVYSDVLSVLPVVLLFSLIFAIFATVKTEKAGFFARLVVAINFAYYFIVSVLFSLLGMGANGGEIAIDLIPLAVAGAMLVLMLALVIADLKKKAGTPIVSFFFALVIVALYLYGTVISCGAAVDKMLTGTMYTKNFVLTTFALSAFVFLATTSRLAFTKHKAFDVLFCCVSLYGSIVVLGGAFFYNTLKTEWFAVATVVTFFQLLINVSSMKAQCPVATVAAVEEAEENEEAEQFELDEALLPAEDVNLDEQRIGVCENVYTVSAEEYEEACVEQTPCEPLFTLNFASTYMKNKQSEAEAEAEAAAEATATPACETAPATKPVSAYDWFIESLTFEERQEFVSLFIYKKLGGTATLPEYVAGGDNYAFFRCFFLNLGKYRDRISATLLDKMYNYMTNLY